MLSRTALCQPAEQLHLVHPQIRRLKWDIGDFRSFGLGKLANAVHRVVVIEGQEVLSLFGKGIGFPHQFEGPGGIRGGKIATYSSGEALK